MIRRPPSSTRTDTLCPYTTLFRSAALGLRQAVVGDSEAGTMVEAVAPYRMGVAEPAHREDRSRRDQRQAASAAEVGVEPRDAPRACGPLYGTGRAAALLFGPSLSCVVPDDPGPPVPGIAAAVVVVVDGPRA